MTRYFRNKIYLNSLFKSNYCLCGNSFLNTQSTPVSDTFCNVPCAGNSAELCGGSGANYVSVYKPGRKFF